MTKQYHNTPSGDRKRDRAAGQARGQRKPMEGNHIRVRAKRLDQVDPDKLALAYWLLAMRLVDDRTVPADSDTLEQSSATGDGATENRP
jgi:hypothetical protein